VDWPSNWIGLDWIEVFGVQLDSNKPNPVSSALDARATTRTVVLSRKARCWTYPQPINSSCSHCLFTHQDVGYFC
jgi:hypothetical protein